MSMKLSDNHLKEQFKNYQNKDQAALAKLIQKYEKICDIIGDHKKVRLGMKVCFKDWISDYKVCKMINNSIIDYVEDDIFDEICVREKWIETIKTYLTKAKELLEKRRVDNIENSKVKLKSYLNEKITCNICDGIFSRVNIHRHNNTDKHKKALLRLNPEAKPEPKPEAKPEPEEAEPEEAEPEELEVQLMDMLQEYEGDEQIEDEICNIIDEMRA